jgi:predicted O-linked N-acetylglucosamine transferase (SPINDLY family)
MILILPWPPRILSPNNRSHWAKKSPVRAKYRADCTYAALAAGVPELITYHLPDYEQKAISLARNPAEHKALRDRVSRARHSAAFDMGRLAQEVEHCLLQIARPTLA